MEKNYYLVKWSGENFYGKAYSKTRRFESDELPQAQEFMRELRRKSGIIFDVEIKKELDKQASI